MAGIVHFARFFVFMETAEHELLRSLGAEIHLRREGIELGWPRVAASCEYFQPLRYGEEVEIAVRVARKGRSSVTWESTFHRGHDLIARGQVTSVCCRVGEPGGPRSVPIPEPLSGRLAALAGEGEARRARRAPARPSPGSEDGLPGEILPTPLP
jgi:YbgC/YbaW family acyl-CoA thioester hydrolase